MTEIVHRIPVAASGPIHENPVMDRVYRNRGISSLSEIDYSINNMLDYKLMKDVEKAGRLLADAIESGKRILCVGDYDVDGATSTSVVIEALQMFGSKESQFIVPNRFTMGYGLTPKVVDMAAKHQPDVIITVDNGIASFDGAQAVRDLPWPCKLIITDHHLVPPDRGAPEADAVVNPQQSDCQYPSKNIAGCGVALCAMLATRDELVKRGYFDRPDTPNEPKMARLLDLVALGLVCDVVPLDYSNRVLISNGLRIINSEWCRPGIRALLEVGDRLKGGPIVSTDLGFCVGPRLNAAGRLDDMTLGINCLLSKSSDEAKRFAQDLDLKNKERKEIESAMKEDALVDLESFDAGENYTLVVFNENFHEGVQGIVASRLKERFYRPTVCFSKGEDGMIKGSSRSIDGFHFKHALDAINARHEGLLPKFGGHAMAAGLSIREEDLELFKEALEKEARREMNQDDLLHKVEVDGFLEEGELSVELAHLIEMTGPWGQKFPEPSFEGQFEILKARPVGGGKHLQMTLMNVVDGETVGKPIKSISFNCLDITSDVPSGRIHAVYKPQVNRFRGEESLQLMVDWFEVMPEPKLIHDNDDLEI